MIEVHRISKAFGGIRAVDDCSLEIPSRRITGLIGPNGAGKSTLFNIIAGALTPDAGQVRLEGEDVTGLAPHRRFGRGLARTFQLPHEFARMTVRENLMVVPAGQSGERLLAAWLAPRSVAREERALAAKADEVLEFLQIAPLADEPAGNLSGGQKKLLELGRVMMAEPKVALLDEPGAGVNPTLLRKLIEAIRRLNVERGYTFCIIEHDMDLVARLCDPIIVMAQGRVLARGSMDEIRRNAAVREAYLGGTLEAA
ncbi:MAG TPA: ABC transporter ATP-binding protein [Burkholderiales bacterium]|nr:ABC transporter ATP-binding protein [Burkholderiales bacterium]